MRRKFARSNAQAGFKVFLLAVPQSAQSSLNDPRFQLELYQGFSTTVGQTYKTGAFTLVGKTACPPSYPFDNVENARKGMNMAKAAGANLVVLLQESRNTGVYSVFKDLADREYGFHSLVVVWKGKPLSPQYWGNVAMKVNLKAGGINHTTPDVSKLMKDTLVLGA